MKVCRECGISKPFGDFYAHPGTADGLLALCKECQKKASRDRHARLRDDPEYKRGNARRARVLRLRKYGLSESEYEALLQRQGGVCAICGSTHPGLDFSFFPVDHDHTTGEVRGLLCNDCNLGIQRFKDNPDFLVAAAAYLLKHVNVLEWQGEKPCTA